MHPLTNQVPTECRHAACRFDRLETHTDRCLITLSFLVELSLLCQRREGRPVGRQLGGGFTNVLSHPDEAAQFRDEAMLIAGDERFYSALDVEMTGPKGDWHQPEQWFVDVTVTERVDEFVELLRKVVGL